MIVDVELILENLGVVIRKQVTLIDDLGNLEAVVRNLQDMYVYQSRVVLFTWVEVRRLIVVAEFDRVAWRSKLLPVQKLQISGTTPSPPPSLVIESHSFQSSYSC